jgi:putative Holliday junction resolvase
VKKEVRAAARYKAAADLKNGKVKRGNSEKQLGYACQLVLSCENLCNMRILGLDFGSRTVGVAVSDALLLTAQGVETIERKDENKLRRTCARIDELIASYEVDRIVLGLPKNMNNTEGERVEKTKEFKEILERRTGLPVILWDERLTTVAAERILMENGVRRENRKAVIDKVAACLILQGYLDHLSVKKETV